MSRKTRLITTDAILIALSVIALYAASVMPTGQVGFVAIAALFGIAAVVETGIKGGITVYAGSLILGLLLTANKIIMVPYGLFLGYYPIIKSLAEHCRSRIVEWVVKLAVMNAALTVIILLFRSFVFDVQSFTDSVAVIYAVVNVVYIVFDIGVSRVIVFYIEKISKRAGRDH